MPKKTFVKQVLNNDRPDTKFQYDVKGSVERSRKIKRSEVFNVSNDKKKDKVNKK